MPDELTRDSLGNTSYFLKNYLNYFVRDNFFQKCGHLLTAHAYNAFVLSNDTVGCQGE